MELELRHLRRIVAIADAGSVSAAARALNVSPAALTAQLARIEARMGEPLFTRSAATMTPTLRGRDVLAAARTVLAEMSELVAESRRDRSAALRLVGPEYVLAPVVARFAALRPDVAVSTRMADAHVAAELLRDGAAEASATIRWPHGAWPLSGAPGVEVHEVDRAPLHVLLPDTHVLARAGLLDLAALSGEAWCVRTEPALADAVIAECVRHGFGPDIRYRLDSDDAVGEMVATGRAVALVAHPPRAPRGTLARPYRDAARSRLVLAWRASAVAPDMARHLVAAIEGWHATRAWAAPADPRQQTLGSAARPLRIGSIDERATMLTAPRLRTVHGLHSEIDVGLQDDLLTSLDRGDLDLVLCQGLALPDQLLDGRPHRVVSRDEPIVVVLGAGHRLAAARVSLDSLADENWAVRRASGDAEILRALGAAAGFEPRIASTFTDARQVAAAVASGRLIRLADPADPDQGIVHATIDHPAARRTLLLVWPPDGRAAGLADLVAEELRLARVPYVNPYPDDWP